MFWCFVGTSSLSETVYGWLLTFSRGWRLHHWQNRPPWARTLTFLQLQEGVSTLRKIILDSCIRFHDVSTNTGTRLCHSQKQYMHITVREGSNSCSTVIETRLYHSKNALLSEARRTGMTSLWSDSMMTVYNVIQYYWQNSPPQARIFLKGLAL